MALVNAYCTVADVKATLRITDNVDDTLIENAVQSASRLIDGYCSRQFWQAGSATPRVFNATDDFVCEVDDMSGTAITLKTSSLGNTDYDTTWEVTDYTLEPMNGVLDGLVWSYTRIRASGNYLFPTITTTYTLAPLVQVTARWGWPSVPDPVKQATILQSARIYKRYDSPLGVAGFGDFGVMRVSRALDPDVSQLVEPYRRIRNLA